MKKLIQVSIFLFLAFNSFSQERPPELQQELDSLWNIWQNTNQPDSVRVMAYRKYLRNGFAFSNPDTVAILADELIVYGEKNNYPHAISVAYGLKGLSFLDKGDYPKALDYYTESFKIQEKLKDQKGIAASLNRIGLIYTYQGYYPKALKYYTQSLKINEQLGDQKGMALSLNNIGIIYANQGDYSQARDYYTQSLKIREQMGDQEYVASSLNNIGLTYLMQGDYPKALKYFTQSLKINEQLGDQKGIASSLKNIGGIHFSQGDYSQALDYYIQSLKIMEQLGNQRSIVNSLCSIGITYKNQGDYPKALKHCLRALELAKSIKIIKYEKYACECLYKTYKAMGNGNKALQYHEQILVFEDSLQAEETAKKLQQMEFQKQVTKDSLATVEKEHKVEAAHKEEMRQEEKNRNIAIATGIFFLLIAGGFFGRWRYTKKAKAIIEKEKDRSENLLLNILPAEVAEELKQKGEAEARDYDMVSILFTDFKGFTEQSEKLSAAALVKEINNCFKAFDAICEKYKVEKIKTIGDAYMAAGGLPIPEETSIKNTVLAALEMQAFIVKQHQEKEAKGEHAFQMRVGIHTGPVVAGIVGVKKFQYDIWGDTVNTASRMESSGEVGKVNISEATYNYLKDDPDFVFESRGKINAKGKGEIEMYFVSKS